MNIQNLSLEPEEIDVQRIAADNQRHAAGTIIKKNIFLGRQNTKINSVFVLFIDI